MKRIFLAVAALVLHSQIFAEETNPRANELRAIFREFYHPKQIRMMVDLMDRMKLEDVDAMHAVLEEHTKAGLALEPWPSLYWRRRTELEGMKTFERITDGDLANRGKTLFALRAVAEVCAMQHRKELLQWVRANPAHVDFQNVFHTLCNVIAQTDADGATDLVFELAKDRQKDELGQYFGGITASISIASGGYEAVASWFDRQTDERKALLFQYAMSRMSMANFATGGKWWAAQIGKPWWGEPEKVLYRRFLTNYAKEKPEETLAFIVTTPESKPGVFDGLTSTISTWAQRDPIASGKWLQSKFEEKWWLRAAAGYHKGLRYKNPELASDFLQKLPPEIRAKVNEAVEALAAEKSAAGSGQ